MPELRSPPPVLVTDLFPLERAALLDLLEELSADDWFRPTICPGWSAKDIALHILGGGLNNLSRRRDGFRERVIGPNDDLVSYLNGINEAWVQGARGLSGRVIVDLLRDSADQTQEYFSELDPFRLGAPVSWAPAPAPIWLDIAREYTERWVHQQQIRNAIGRPGLKEPHFFAPVLATFVRALPWTQRGVDASEGSGVILQITGESGGIWSGIRGPDGWELMLGALDHALAQVIIDQDIAWRLFTRGIGPSDARLRITTVGDERFISAVLKMVAIVA